MKAKFRLLVISHCNKNCPPPIDEDFMQLEELF